MKQASSVIEACFVAYYIRLHRQMKPYVYKKKPK